MLDKNITVSKLDLYFEANNKYNNLYLSIQLLLNKLTLSFFKVGGYSWSQQKCMSLLQCYDPQKDQWSVAGNIPIELSGVRLATLTIPYSVSAKSGLVSGSHVPLSWPRQHPHLVSEQVQC